MSPVHTRLAAKLKSGQDCGKMDSRAGQLIKTRIGESEKRRIGEFVNLELIRN